VLSFGFGRRLHESPERSIREIQTHEVCPGWETAPGLFHVRDPPPRAALDAQAGENQMTFEKGQSGNPAGRPPDSRNKATILAEAMFQGEAEAIILLGLLHREPAACYFSCN
jgi:hypothetical protein